MTEEIKKTETTGKAEVNKKETAPKFKVKKVENANVFKFQEVEYRNALVADSINAEKVSGQSEGIEFLLALMAECCTFDGKKVVYEQIRQMESDDFLELSEALGLEPTEVLSQPAEEES